MTRGMTAVAVLLSSLLAFVSQAGAQPVISEPSWTLIRTIDFTSPISACLNEVDGSIYVGRRGTSADGLYRIDRYGLAVWIASGSNPAGVAIQPDSGHVFVSEDYGGVIYRTALGTTGRQTWVSGFHSGDDDPIGMAFAPAGYTGDVLAPEEALVVDRGNSGPDEVWRWSPLIPEGEVLVHADSGILVDALDIAVDETAVYLVDGGGAADGIIYELAADGTLSPFATSEPIGDPAGIVFDPAGGDLLVIDQTSGRVVRVNRSTGVVNDVVTGLAAGTAWAGVDMSSDARQLVVTESGANQIHILARCDASEDPDLDCDGNGVYDLCDIALGTATDCNGNGLPDVCDLASGTSDDCNLDGIPDDCPICPPVEVVFIMDTSTSMDDEAAALCGSINAVVVHLEAAGVEVQARLLGICDTPGGAYACLEDHVANLLGTTVPSTPPPGLETLGACPGGLEVCQEDWGLATAVVAGAYPWLPATESIRLVIPLSDEGSWCGDPVTQLDQDAITFAVAVALASGVIVSPITGSGSSSSVIALAQSLADETGGIHFASTTPSSDIADAIVELVLAACSAFTDCNDNDVLDECDIASGFSLDENGNGIPDECESTGVGLSELPLAGVRLAQNYPNPFNPLTTIRFDLARAQAVVLAVYAVDGRRIATLLNGTLPGGSHEVRWNGRDDLGRQIPSGTYFYSLQVGKQALTKRMTLLK